MWRELGKNLMDFNIVFGAMDCDLAPAACAARKIADGPSPVLKYWTGETFRRYSGAFKLRSLQEYAASKIGQFTQEQKDELGIGKPAPQAQQAEPARERPSFSNGANLPPEEMRQLRIALEKASAARTEKAVEAVIDFAGRKTGAPAAAGSAATAPNAPAPPTAIPTLTNKVSPEHG